MEKIDENQFKPVRSRDRRSNMVFNPNPFNLKDCHVEVVPLTTEAVDKIVEKQRMTKTQQTKGETRTRKRSLKAQRRQWNITLKQEQKIQRYFLHNFLTL